MNLHEIVPTMIPTEPEEDEDAEPTDRCPCGSTRFYRTNWGTYTERYTVNTTNDWGDWDDLDQNHEGDNGWFCSECAREPTNEALIDRLSDI